jgi:hypothetical protein
MEKSLLAIFLNHIIHIIIYCQPGRLFLRFLQLIGAYPIFYSLPPVGNAKTWLKSFFMLMARISDPA